MTTDGSNRFPPCSPTPPSIASASNTHYSSAPGGGKVAGAVIGAIAGVAVLAGAAWWWFSKQRRAAETGDGGFFSSFWNATRGWGGGPRHSKFLNRTSSSPYEQFLEDHSSSTTPTGVTASVVRETQGGLGLRDYGFSTGCDGSCAGLSPCTFDSTFIYLISLGSILYPCHSAVRPHSTQLLSLCSSGHQPDAAPESGRDTQEVSPRDERNF